MLAKTAPSLEAALQQVETAAVEWKLDGVRIQVHRDGDDVAVFTRTLDPVGERMPEVVEAVRALPLQTVILDGEAIALRPDGRPRPFQETASRAAEPRQQRRAARGRSPHAVLLRRPARRRPRSPRPASKRAAGRDRADVAGRRAWVPRLVGNGLEAAQALPRRRPRPRGTRGWSSRRGPAPYEAGRRGAGWLKVKPVHTLDLVVLAAEWGHGQRRGSSRTSIWEHVTRGNRRIRDARQDVQGAH